jgi:hypothetical protein
MEESFAAVVGSSRWREQALSWIEQSLGSRGLSVTGEVAQPRIRPWSTQLVVPTDEGRFWFKANCRALAFEPAVHVELGRLVPWEVEPPAAFDAARGWLLTADRGLTLGERHEPTLADWQTVVGLAAELQRAVAAQGKELLDAGLPDCSPATVPDRFDALVATFSALPPDHPSHLRADEREELEAGRPTVVEAVQASRQHRCRPPSSTATCTRATSSSSRVGCGSSTSATPCGRTRWRPWRSLGAG